MKMKEKTIATSKIFCGKKDFIRRLVEPILMNFGLLILQTMKVEP